MLRSQNLIPLTSGAYQSRSKLANYMICENLFPEINPEEAEPDAPTTHYPREGKRPLSAPPTAAPGRGVFTLSNGALFAVVGATLYHIDQDWKWRAVGSISGQGGMILSVGLITVGAGGAPKTYKNVSLTTTGAGKSATADITVGAAGSVSSVLILNPGLGFAAGDALSAASGDIGGVVGFSTTAKGVSAAGSLLGQQVTTPVSMSDNGNTGVLVDGTPNGWAINLVASASFAKDAFGPVIDPTGLFVGSRRVDFSDTFLAFAAPGTNEWYVSLSDQVVFNELVQANKDSTPDPIQTLAFNIRQMWLLGSRNSEVWYLAGSTPFPYQEWPNIFVPFGIAAPYSLVRADVDLFWISSNAQGRGIAVMTKGYGVEAISTRALEYEWSTYPTVADVVGGTFQQGGHTFVVFHFPTADVSWGYDLATKQWHKRTYIDQNGVVHREKTAFYASVGQSGGYRETIIGQDWQTGALYALDPKFYTDDGMPIVFRRSFPHQVQDLKEVTHVSFVADFETGEVDATTDVSAGSPWSSAFSSAFGLIGTGVGLNAGPVLCMRISRDGGYSFGNYRQKGLVSAGNYRSMMRYRGLGMARDAVYELMWSFPGPSALQGAYLEPIVHGA